ncbi:hypothetical protein LSAT2_030852 [Lamellibrachia satsuma]|nr:hypothetical protein LSAT2_030852 [Lamellibrachia satsuma]
MFTGDSAHPVSLTCATCQQEFNDSWDLCRHCQSCHGIHIYADSMEDNHSVTSDSACSGGTSETQGSANRNNVTETPVDVLNHRDNGYNESATETVGITDDWMTAASVDLHAEEDGRCHEREDLEENDQHIDGVQHTNGVERIDGAEHTNGVEHIDAVASPDNVSASTQPGEIEASTQDKSTKCCLKNGFLSTLQLSLKS